VSPQHFRITFSTFRGMRWVVWVVSVTKNGSGAPGKCTTIGPCLARILVHGVVQDVAELYHPLLRLHQRLRNRRDVVPQVAIESKIGP